MLKRKIKKPNFQSVIDNASLVEINNCLPDILRKQGKGWGSSTTKEEVQAILKVGKLKFQESNNIFDIGANVGLYTEVLLEMLPNANVYAFEPSQKAFLELQSKFENNSRVRLINSAVGSTTGITSLFSDVSGSGMASLTKRRMDHFNLDFEYVENIQITKLDDWCHEYNIWPNVIKMDVEGHELDVLKNGEKAIRTSTVIQFEFGGCNIDTRTYFQDFWYLFKEFNFNIWRITPSGLDQILNYSEYDECFTTTNYIAVKNNL